MALQPDAVRRNNREYRRPLLYALSALALVTGLWLMREQPFVSDLFEKIAALDPLGRGRPVTLTGVDRAGRLEVPVLNLWRQPGFGRDNAVAARVRLPATGLIEARLVDEIEVDGLKWDEVRVNDAHGWLIGQFVRNIE